MSSESDKGAILRELADLAAKAQEWVTDHEEYLYRMVGCLRRAGATWEDVGEALGVSKQAAWQRYRDVGSDPPGRARPRRR